MPTQKAQQIEFTGSAYERNAREQEPRVVLFFTDCRRLVSHLACNRRVGIGRATRCYCDSPNETGQHCTHLDLRIAHFAELDQSWRVAKSTFIYNLSHKEPLYPCPSRPIPHRLKPSVPAAGRAGTFSSLRRSQLDRNACYG